VKICRNDGVGNSTCCDAHVVAEQTAIDHCGPYDSSLFGALPTDVPYSQTCSDLVLLATPFPFVGNFGDVKDRIDYGRLRCCTL
jgi:hypothetical protein